MYKVIFAQNTVLFQLNVEVGCIVADIKIQKASLIPQWSRCTSIKKIEKYSWWVMVTLRVEYNYYGDVGWQTRVSERDIGASRAVWREIILDDIVRVVRGAGRVGAGGAARRGAVRASCSGTATTSACAAARWHGSGARPTSRPLGYSPPAHTIFSSIHIILMSLIHSSLKQTNVYVWSCKVLNLNSAKDSKTTIIIKLIVKKFAGR